VRDIGRLIRARRQDLGWSQTELAQRLDTSRRWVSEIEHGKSTAQVGLVLAALEALGFDVRVEHASRGGESREHVGGTLQPSAADLDEILSGHTTTVGYEPRPVTFLRTNR
jgi:y4mF family transcriptional regulator